MEAGDGMSRLLISCRSSSLSGSSVSSISEWAGVEAMDMLGEGGSEWGRLMYCK